METGGGAKLQRCGSSRQEKLESFELIGWNSLQLDLFVEDVARWGVFLINRLGKI